MGISRITNTKPFVFSLLAGAIVLVSTWMVNFLLQSQGQRAAVAVATAKAQIVAANLESSLHERLELTHGLSAFVRSRWEFSQIEFDAFAEALQDGYPEIRSLQLAPSAVVRFLTNLEQNQAAMGHDLRGDPKRSLLVSDAIRNRRYIISGPLNLIQGGQALIARLPIYRPGEGTATENFWGFATVLLDPNGLIQNSGLHEGTEFFEFALRGKDGRCAIGEMIWGNKDVFANSEFRVPVTLPVGTWLIAGSPRPDKTFHNFSLEVLIWLAGILIAGLVSFLLYAKLRLPEALKRQVERALRTADAERDTAKQLQVERLKADLANEAKSTFLANMSHEIRTPMNGVIGMLDVLQTTSLQDDQEHMVGTIQRSAQSLLRILDDIIDMSKIETGKLAVFEHPFQLCMIVEDVLNTFGPIATDAKVKLDFDWQPHEVNRRVLGDELRLKQILVNLIGNAVKFTKATETGAGGQVGVSLEKLNDGRTRFVVSDNGIGITEAQKAGLFDRFTQADETTTRQFGGAGLGLSITRDLIELMGGTIEVSSQFGAGSEFTVTLPLRDKDTDRYGVNLKSLRIMLLCGSLDEQAQRVEQLLIGSGAKLK